MSCRIKYTFFPELCFFFFYSIIYDLRTVLEKQLLWRLKDLYNSHVLNSAILGYLCSFTKQGEEETCKTFKMLFKKKDFKGRGKVLSFHSSGKVCQSYADNQASSPHSKSAECDLPLSVTSKHFITWKAVVVFLDTSWESLGELTLTSIYTFYVSCCVLFSHNKMVFSDYMQEYFIWDLSLA